MIKQIELNLEAVESMLYLWSALAEKEKVAESFFVDVANMYPMKAIMTKNFNEESVRKVLSAIQNRELLSDATKEEKRFWNNNMWMMEDLELPNMMAKPIKVLNVNHLIEKLNKEFPDNKKEILKVYIAPLHLDDHYIVDGNLIINFFRIMLPDGENAFIESMPIDDYIYEKLKEVLKHN